MHSRISVGADKAQAAIKNMTIALLDDEESQIILLESILKHAGFRNVYAYSEADELLEVIDSKRPDLLLLDFNMPRLNGLEVMHLLGQRLNPVSFFPVLVLTADCRAKTKEAMLQAGAKDFVTKPFNVPEVLLRVKNLLETRLYYLELERQKASLERLVQERTQQLEQFHAELLGRLELSKRGEPPPV